VAETLRSWVHVRGTAVDRTYVDELCDRLDLDQTRETRGLSSGDRCTTVAPAFMAPKKASGW